MLYYIWFSLYHPFAVHSLRGEGTRETHRSVTRFFTKCMEEYRELEVISLRHSMRATVGNSACRASSETPCTRECHRTRLEATTEPRAGSAASHDLGHLPITHRLQSHGHAWMLTRNKRQKSCVFERKMQSDTNVRIVFACSCCVALFYFGSF